MYVIYCTDPGTSYISVMGDKDGKSFPSKEEAQKVLDYCKKDWPRDWQSEIMELYCCPLPATYWKASP